MAVLNKVSSSNSIVLKILTAAATAGEGPVLMWRYCRKPELECDK